MDIYLFIESWFSWLAWKIKILFNKTEKKKEKGKRVRYFDILNSFHSSIVVHIAKYYIHKHKTKRTVKNSEEKMQGKTNLLLWYVSLECGIQYEKQ